MVLKGKVEEGVEDYHTGFAPGLELGSLPYHIDVPGLVKVPVNQLLPSS